MLTGELPLGKFAPPSRKVKIDVQLDRVVLGALEKEPERRYQQAAEVKTDVETIGMRIDKPPRRSFPNELGREVLKLFLYGFAILAGSAVLWMAMYFFRRDERTTPAELSREGWQLWQARQFNEAIPKFRHAVELAPNDANAWNGLGWASFNSGNAAQAEAAFLKCLELSPDHPAALNGLGQLYLAQGKFEPAGTYLLKAAPQAPAAWYGLARLYLLQGNFSEAERWALRVVESGQGDATAQKMLDAARAKELPEGLRLVIAPSLSTAAESLGVDSLPPVVVSTEPVSGSHDVAPGVTVIRVSFSKGMMPGTWSWSSAWSNSTPQILPSYPRYEADGRTCVLAVNLEPGRTYAFWLNSERFKNFRDSEGRPAVPYLLIFETKPK